VSSGSATLLVAGLPKLRRAMRKLGADVEDLKTANALVADLVAAAAAVRAPRRSGALAASVRGNRAVSRATVAAGGARVPYAGPIHWGWPARHITGQPFISDAAQATEQTWLPIYARDVQAAVDKVGGLY
jgi:hypothetical protein